MPSMRTEPLDGLVEAAQDIQQRGLAGAGRAHDGDPLAGVRRVKLTPSSAFTGSAAGAARTCLRHIFQFEKWHRRLFSPQDHRRLDAPDARRGQPAWRVAATASVTPATGSKHAKVHSHRSGRIRKNAAARSTRLPPGPASSPSRWNPAPSSRDSERNSAAILLFGGADRLQHADLLAALDAPAR